jgi:hypothetical protein
LARCGLILVNGIADVNQGDQPGCIKCHDFNAFAVGHNSGDFIGRPQPPVGCRSMIVLLFDVIVERLVVRVRCEVIAQ